MDPRSLPALAALGACVAAMRPELARGDTPTPGHDPSGAPFSAKTRAAPAEGPLRVVTLAEVERTADAQQPQIRIARASTHGAEGQAEQARAPMLPQVTASAAYTRQTGNFVARPGVLPSSVSTPSWSLSTSFDYWNFGVSGTQLLYDFGQSSQRYHAAEATIEADRLFERTTHLQIRFGVRRAYFNARATKELVGVARETLEQQDRHLRQVQGFVEVGTQPEIALAQERAALANARVQLIIAQNNYETAKAQLNQAAGIPGSTEYDVADEALGPLEDEDQPLETLVAKAITARPELATIARQRVAQEAVLSSARGAYGPTLSAAAGASEQGTFLDRLVPNWNAGVLLNWPVFQGGLTRGQVDQAEAGLESIDAQRSIEELQVRLDVDSARLAVRAAKATIGAAEDAGTNAREQLRLAEQRYATGVGGILELNDAQVAYTAASAQVVQARYTLATARAQLLAALGRQ